MQSGQNGAIAASIGMLGGAIMEIGYLVWIWHWKTKK
jgi:hypothetical protein